MTEHLELLATSYAPHSNQHNGKTLLCWDWRPWDYYVHCVEKRLILDAMERLTDRYVKGPARVDILDELKDIKADTDQLILDSQCFANESYMTEVDCIIKGSGGPTNHWGDILVNFRPQRDFQVGRTLAEATIL
jgi:hypothetical protein